MKMKFWFLLILLPASVSAQDLTLWYNEPASRFDEALPLGNGRMGVMLYGGIRNEKLHLNEATFWSGGPVDANPNPGAAAFIPAIREALRRKDYAAADSLTRKVEGRYTESYAPLGDLFIQMDHDSNATSYRRELDMHTATAFVVYRHHGVSFERTAFVSAPDQVIATKLTVDKPGALSFQVGQKSLMRPQFLQDGEAVMNGRSPSHIDPDYLGATPQPIVWDDPSGCRGVRFSSRLAVRLKGGSISTTADGFRITGASEAILLVSIATSFNGYDKCPGREGKDEKALAQQMIRTVINTDWNELLKRHVADHQQFFDRVSLSLPLTKASSAPTRERLKAFGRGSADPSFAALYFQLGRYLLIASSRTAGAPANLQGIWNATMRAPWSSNYTVNINTEMNYWPAEVTNLSEMHMPLLTLAGEMAQNGKATASNFYGVKEGWSLNHNSDIWATTNPVGNNGEGSPQWATFPLGGAWIAQHVYEHFRFTGDKEWLRQVGYPIMREAAMFASQWLVEDGRGHWVTSPSTSPENEYYAPGSRQRFQTSTATTCDMSLCWDLFGNVIEASQILGVDADLRSRLIGQRGHLMPLQIGKSGVLQEWVEDYEDVDPHHRHVSHLFGLFPGHQISPRLDPVFADAARQSLLKRGDDGTGWAKSWKISLWARLYDGNHAHRLLRELLEYVEAGEMDYHNKGGTYANLLCAHPPFQIDGNFGGTAGVAEMLLQSHLGYIEVLPALPEDWSTGKFNGLVARGNVVVDATWEKGLVQSVRLKARAGGKVKLKSPFSNDSFYLNGVNGSTTDGMIELDMKPGSRILLTRLP